MDDLYTPAPEGQIYVCSACGKTSPTRSGDADGKRVASRLWDESCMFHAVLCYAEKHADGRWVAVERESDG